MKLYSLPFDGDREPEDISIHLDRPIHRCVGDDGCEVPAGCEHCGVVATEETPVYVLSIEGEDYFLCVAGVENEGWRIEP